MMPQHNVEEATPFPRLRSPSPAASSQEESNRPIHPSESVFNSLVVTNPSGIPSFVQSSDFEASKAQMMSLGPVRTLSHNFPLPFLISNNYNPEYSEKYQQIKKNKQKKAKKSGEKNVVAVKKSEDVEGYEGDKDVNTLLRSLGENAEEDDKKSKARRPKAERVKGDKKRKSLEKSSDEEGKEGEQEEEEEGELAEVAAGFRLIGLPNGNIATPEVPGLSRLKSNEALAGSTESLNFTKVTNKKNRSRRRGEETGRPPPGAPPGPPPGPLPPTTQSDSRRTSYYALRSRDVPAGGRAVSSRGSGTISPVDSLAEVLGPHHHQPAAAALVVEVDSLLDFPELRPHTQDTEPSSTGGTMKESPLAAGSGRSAWVAKVSPKQDMINTVAAPPTQACDISAVIDLNHSAHTIVPTQQHSQPAQPTSPPTPTMDSTGCSAISADTSRNIFEENINSKDNISDISSLDTSMVVQEAEENSDMRANYDSSNRGGVVFDTKSCLTGAKADQNANFLTEMVELEFGFEVNAELLKGSSAASVAEEEELPRTVEPLRSIGSMDTAILSYATSSSGNLPHPPPGLAPVFIPVGVPFGMFQATGLPAFLPFPHMHQVDEQQYAGTQLVEEEAVDGGAGDNNTVVSPESGISSASPLSSPSLHPDSSPILQSRPTQEESCQMLEQVNTSLEAWSGHSTSSSHNSSRASPHGWATQVDISFGTGEDSPPPAAGPTPDCSNYREIVSFLQQSWSMVNTDAKLKFYRDSPRPLLQ